MNCITHEFDQGSAEWAAHRSKHYNASDASALMGLSSYRTRSDLIKQMATSWSPEIDSATQRRFDKGHEYEAMARPWAEEIIGEDLYPAVVSREVDGLPLGASTDGLTMAAHIIWEHKTLNESLSASMGAGIIPAEYEPQMEQGMLITGATRCLFMASNGNRDTMLHLWYTPKPNLRQALVSAWKQLREDIAAYVPAETQAIVVAAAVKDLPAPSIRMDGAIAVISNLDIFGEQLKAFVAGIDMAPTTDQAFADAEAAVKTLQKAQDALEAGKAAALAQTATIDEMCRTVDHYAEIARNARLLLEKVVKQQKEKVRADIVADGKAKFLAHTTAINARLKRVTLPVIAANWEAVVKNKRTIDSLRGAVADELARVKIEANDIAERYSANLAALDAKPDYVFLFSDLAAIVGKAPDDFAMLMTLRISQHEAAAKEKAEKEAEAAREKIRQQERQKLIDEEAERQRAAAKATAVPATGQAPFALGDVLADALAAPAPAVEPGRAFTGGYSTAQRRTSISFAAPPAVEVIAAVAAHFGVTQNQAKAWLSAMVF